MKKAITVLLTIIFVLSINSMIYAQNVPIDFETGGNGADWTWTVFENDTNPPLEIIPNPDATGANTSATVAKFTALQLGNPWAGCESLHGADIGTFTLDETNCIVKIMVWKPVISDVGIKFALPDGGALPEIKVANTVTNQWEELTFDFSGRIGDPVTIGQDQIIIFPDFDLEGRTQDNVCYFDNITFSEQGGSSEDPTEAAPTPTVPEENVISLFSDAYTDVTVDTWRTDWSVATFEDVTIEGNAAKKYSSLDFVGIETVGENSIDATEMTHVHLDVWSSDFTFFGLKLVDFGADNAYGGGDDVEHQINWETPNQGEWISIDLPLTDFTNLTTREHLSQYILVGQPTGATTVYIDNFYFHNAPNAIEETHGSIASQYVLEQNYPNPFNPSTTIRVKLPQTNHVTLKVYNMMGQEIATLVDQVKQAGIFEVNFDASDLPSGTYIYSISSGSFTSVKKMLLIK